MDEVETLIGKLNSPVDEVRMEAAKALGKIGDTRAVEPLIGLIRDRIGGVRATARYALADIGEPAVLPLIALLKDHDAEVRLDAVSALVNMGEPAVKPLVEASRKPGNEALRATIAKILERIDEGAKRKQQDFGCVEKEVLRAPEIPDDFRKAMLDKTVKVRV